MKEQNFKNHSRLLISYHLILLLLILAVLIMSVVVLVSAIGNNTDVIIPILIVMIALVITILGWLTRSFALKAQDRAIRAEENLRYFAITGNLMDPKLTTAQIIALRFAPNNEFADLAHKAVEENLSPKEIKKAIQHWKADHYRV